MSLDMLALHRWTKGAVRRLSRDKTMTNDGHDVRHGRDGIPHLLALAIAIRRAPPVEERAIAMGADYLVAMDAALEGDFRMMDSLVLVLRAKEQAALDSARAALAALRKAQHAINIADNGVRAPAPWPPLRILAMPQVNHSERIERDLSPDRTRGVFARDHVLVDVGAEHWGLPEDRLAWAQLYGFAVLNLGPGRVEIDDPESFPQVPRVIVLPGEQLEVLEERGMDASRQIRVSVSDADASYRLVVAGRVA